MSRGAVTLSQLEGRLTMLKITCKKCGRSGQYQLSGILERHGADLSLLDLAAYIAPGCPKRISAIWTDRCEALFTKCRVTRRPQRRWIVSKENRGGISIGQVPKPA